LGASRKRFERRLILLDAALHRDVDAFIRQIATFSAATLLTLLTVPALYAVFVETFRVKPIRLG
jgi:hypothetical protein